MATSKNKMVCRSSSVSSPLSSKKAGNEVTKSTCIAGCAKYVTPAHKAFMCDFCEEWCHLECDDRITPKLYVEMNRSPSEAFLYICNHSINYSTLLEKKTLLQFTITI